MYINIERIIFSGFCCHIFQLSIFAGHGYVMRLPKTLPDYKFRKATPEQVSLCPLLVGQEGIALLLPQFLTCLLSSMVIID